jgi:tRNA A37 threonylcarbamoyladenosine synthetase subunit TsaC/SUA5/YrdC
MKPDIAADARGAFDVIKAGGSCIFPVDVGYTFVGGSQAALLRIFHAKGRGTHKRNAMVGDLAIHDEIHSLDARGREMVRTITVGYDLPLGVIAPFRAGHPLIRKLHPESLAGSTEGDTLAMLVNAGPFHAEMCRLSQSETHPLFGSSANLTGSGTKFRVQDIQPELIAVADHIVDYGLRKYHMYRRSATLIDFRSMEVVRVGACYELIQDVLQRHYGVALPPDPGLERLPSGHLREAQRHRTDEV